MNKKFKGVVWTDHAIKRLQDRGIKQSDAWYVFRRPDKSRYAKTKGAWIYKKRLNDQDVEVVAKKEDNKWVILSVWSKGRVTQKRGQTFLEKIKKIIFNY